MNRLREPRTIATATSLSLFAVALLVLEPIWRTNDDVAMSMTAHGYGSAAFGTPTLVFSNVVWGHVVRLIPPLFGVPGYSWATLAALFFVSWLCLFLILRRGVAPVLACAIVAAVMFAPIVFPQFTANAGLLAVAGLLAWRDARERDSRAMLAVALVAILAAFLVRYRECLLVVGVGAPLVFSLRRREILAAVGLTAAMAIVTVIDRRAYAGDEWRPFLDLHETRVVLTDFGGGWLLRNRPEILARHGYSANDMLLLENWFFVDPRIADPVKIRAMLDELGAPPGLWGNASQAFDALAAMWGAELAALTALAVLLCCFAPSRRVLVSWALFVSAVLLMGFAGRPAIVSVYVPLLALMAFAPLASTSELGTRRRRFMLAAAVLVLVTVVTQTVRRDRELAATAATVQKDLSLLGPPLAAWGGAFPFEMAFPVLADASKTSHLRLYGLGTFSLAPFAVARHDDRAGRGLIHRLAGGERVAIVMSDALTPFLAAYCREHVGGRLTDFGKHPTKVIEVHTLQCAVEAQRASSLPGKQAQQADEPRDGREDHR